ncbi:MAG: site-specific integrase [Clostridia bacterium]|nr:site-specific integrase [Clostridia bacterium]
MPSYEKNKSSGLWSCRFRETDETGAIHQKRLSGFATKREAQYGYEDYIKSAEERRNAKKAADEAAAPDPNNMTFDELLTLYFAFKKSRVKESTYYDLTQKIKCRLLPFFTGRRMKDIKPATVLEWQNSLSEYSFRYRSTLMSHLASVYNFGEKYHDVTNILNKVDRPRNLEGKKEMLFWTPEEFNKVLAKLDSPEYKMLFLTLFVTGCRRGEALALTWNDIDTKSQTLGISKSVAHKVWENGKNYKITTPKNVGSNRKIAIPGFLIEQLIEYKEWQLQNKASCDFVFGGENPLPPTSIARYLDKAAEAAGVKKIRIHDLRHSAASYLIHKGVSIVAVSKQLGHNNVEQTLNTYSHMLPDDQTMIRNNLENLGTILGT